MRSRKQVNIFKYHGEHFLLLVHELAEELLAVLVEANKLVVHDDLEAHQGHLLGLGQPSFHL